VIKPTPGDIIFLSDVHLGGYSPEKNSAIESDLISMVRFCIEQKLRLIILGDLFDYWMEYRGHWPEYGELVLREFEHLTKLEPILYITGNHDNWTGPRLEKAGFDIEHEYRILTIGNNKVMLLHGDGLKDAALKLPRPRFHRILRNPYFLSVYQFVFPPKLGISIMHAFSKRSKERDTDELNSTKSIDRWALAQLNHTDLDVIICGHFHVHRFIKNEDGLYINLGTFHSHRTVGLYTKNTFQLVRWNGEEMKFQAFGNT